VAALQSVAVAVLVIGSAVYAAWRLMPASRRLRLIERLLAGAPASSGWVARLRHAARADAEKSCGGCSAAETTRRSSR
jgi:hypothetical protein